MKPAVLLRITWKWKKTMYVAICQVNLMHGCVVGLLWGHLEVYLNIQMMSITLLSKLTLEAECFVGCPWHWVL